MKNSRTPVVSLIRIAVALLAVRAAATQGAVAQQLDLKGKVLDPLGKPVVGAQLFTGAPQGKGNSAVTGADGSYVLKGVQERSQPLRIVRDGYFPRVMNIRPRPGFERIFCLVPQTERTPWIGLQVDERHEKGAALGARPKLRIIGLDAGGPAAKAGVSYGDEVVSCAGQSVSSELDLCRVIAGSKIGDQIALVLKKRDRERVVKVLVARRQTTAEVEQARLAAARKKVFETNRLIYYREAAVTHPPGIGIVQDRTYVVQKPGAVDVKVRLGTAGDYKIQVIAYCQAQGEPLARWSLLIDGKTVESFTTDRAYFKVHEARARIGEGQHVVRVLYPGPDKKGGDTFHLYGLRVLRTSAEKPPSRPQPRPVATISADKFVEKMRQQGSVLWSKQDPHAPALTWVAMKDRFVALVDRNAPAPVEFTAFLDTLDHPKLNVTAFVFTRRAVWAGTDHGLFEYDRHMRKWYQWAIKGIHADVAVSKLSQAPGGRLVIDYVAPGAKRPATAAFDLATRRWAGH